MTGLSNSGKSMQQPLPLLLPARKTYGNWVRHPQVEEACSRLGLWFVQGGLLWLTSDGVAGKSHLLQALADEYPQACLLTMPAQHMPSTQLLKHWLRQCEHHAYWLLDLPAGALPPSRAYAVFHLIERAKSMHKALLLAWRADDTNMPPELESRLRMMEQVEMAAPQKDEDLMRVLDAVLQHMQWDMKDTVLPALLQHVPRTLDEMLAAICKLDAYSVANKTKMNAALALRVLKPDD